MNHCGKGSNGRDGRRRSSFVVLYGDQINRERAYRDLQNGYVGPYGMHRSLKPQKDLWTGEITITNPKGQKEVWKEENGLFTTRYIRVDNKRALYSWEKNKNSGSSFSGKNDPLKRSYDSFGRKIQNSNNNYGSCCFVFLIPISLVIALVQLSHLI